MEVLNIRRCAKYVYIVPEGLRELMTDISREVLRESPDNIYCFIADYLDALMITRENARVAAKVISNLTDASEVIAELLRRTTMTREQASKTAAIIQRAFRKHLRKRGRTGIVEPLTQDQILERIILKTGVTYETADNAVFIIQRSYRKYRARRELEKKLEMVDWRVAVSKTLRLYRRSGVSKHEAERAATLIKAAYKGYYTRRLLKKLTEQPEEEALKLEESVSKAGSVRSSGEVGEDYEYTFRHFTWFREDDDADTTKNKRDAALIIQKAFRSYKKRKFARKTYDKKEPLHLEEGFVKDEAVAEYVDVTEIEQEEVDMEAHAFRMSFEKKKSDSNESEGKYQQGKTSEIDELAFEEKLISETEVIDINQDEYNMNLNDVDADKTEEKQDAASASDAETDRTDSAPPPSTTTDYVDTTDTEGDVTDQ